MDLCKRAQVAGHLPGVKVACSAPPVNHLSFADDTMFFSKANPASCEAHKVIISRIERASGQMINATKSSINLLAKTSNDTKNLVKQTLMIDKEGGVEKYLGLPEHFGKRKRDIFTSIVDKIQQRAHGRFLSRAGKQLFLKLVLAAMPAYAMSCFKLPASLCRRI